MPIAGDMAFGARRGEHLYNERIRRQQIDLFNLRVLPGDLSLAAREVRRATSRLLVDH